MSPMLVGLLSFIVILILIFMGFHVGATLIVVAVTGLLILKGFNVAVGVLQYVPYVSVAEYNFAVFPLFILMGELAAGSGVVDGLFLAARAWLGRFRGGLGMAVAVMGAGLGTITGSAIAASAMMMKTAFPALVKENYDKAAVTGLIAAIGPLATLIPPSVSIVFYGTVTSESISELLIAGFIPGMLSALVYMSLIYILASRNPHKWPTISARYTLKEKIKTTKGVAPIIVMMLIVLGGLYGGIFTPSEAGAAGAVISFSFLLIMQRKKSVKLAFRAVWDSAGTTSMIFFIMIGALLYGRFMSMTGATDNIINYVGGLEVNSYFILFGIMLIYLILGCFLDAFSMMAITLPVVHPLIIILGFDPIWFGVVVVVLCEAGCITPPFGITAFAVKGMIGDQVELWPIFMNALPFVLSMLLVLVIVTVFPQIALWLPSTMG